jgi:hypothetical protein
VSCLYREINVLAENYQKWGYGGGPVYKSADEARFVTRVIDLLIMDAGNELWLTPGTPTYWLEPGKSINLYNAPTIFGNVSYRIMCGKLPGTIDADINLALHTIPGKIRFFVHSPFGKPIRSVSVNGKDWTEIDHLKQAVILPADTEKLKITIYY